MFDLQQQHCQSRAGRHHRSAFIRRRLSALSPFSPVVVRPISWVASASRRRLASWRLRPLSLSLPRRGSRKELSPRKLDPRTARARRVSPRQGRAPPYRPRASAGSPRSARARRLRRWCGRGAPKRYASALCVLSARAQARRAARVRRTVAPHATLTRRARLAGRAERPVFRLGAQRARRAVAAAVSFSQKIPPTRPRARRAASSPRA
jgi:hypothetical protein